MIYEYLSSRDDTALYDRYVRPHPLFLTGPEFVDKIVQAERQLGSALIFFVYVVFVLY
jgi:hypothetical protein